MTGEVILTLGQMAVVSFISTIVVQLLKLWKAANKGALHRGTVTWILVVLAFGMAFFFAFPKFPIFPDLTGMDQMAMVIAILLWLAAILAVLLGTAGIAAAIYNLFMEQVFVAIGWDSDVVQDKALVADGQKPVNGTPEALLK